MALLLLAALLGPAQEEPYTVVLTFQEMHCEQCKADLESTLRQVQGFKSVSFAGNVVTATFEEKAPVPGFTRLPSDLRLQSAAITIRGTVSVAGDRVTFVPKGSGGAMPLQNPEGKDTLGALRQQAGGKNRFQVTGVLSAGGRAIVLGSFQKADWKP